jgi:hypothetical protein
VGTFICYRPSKKSKPGADREESTQRTEVPTPESLSDHSKGKNEDKKEEDEEIHLEQGQRNGGKDQRVSGKKVFNRVQDMVVNIDGRRIESDYHGPGDQTDRVKKIHHLKCHNACCQSENEDPVTEPAEGPVVKGLRPFSFPEEDAIEEIDRSPHGAEPPTEEIAEDEDKQEKPEGRPHPPDDLFLGEEGNDPNERIGTKVEIDRNLQLKRKGRMEDQVEEKSEREGLDRPPQVRDYLAHVALTFFTRTFERSISPSP